MNHSFLINQNERRTTSGSSLVLVIFVSAFLLICGYAALQLISFLGASQETRNGVDAGALHLAARSIYFKVKPRFPLYSDCADLEGKIGLTNINRVWGKAFLIQANALEILNEGLDKGVNANAREAFKRAQSINDDLFSTLTDEDTQFETFNQISSARKAKMLTGGSAVTPVTNSAPWTFGALLRGRASNLTVKASQIPAQAHLDIPLVNVNGFSFMPGYTAIAVGGSDFGFVSFNLGEKPHLVSNSVFEANRLDTHPVPDIKNPIPNAFSASGKVANSQIGLMARACALANPQKNYFLSIPHAYLSIRITPDFFKWFVEKHLRAQGQYPIQLLEWEFEKQPVQLTQLRHLVQPECGFAQVKTPKAVSRSLKG
jgi:hypothetical protein